MHKHYYKHHKSVHKKTITHRKLANSTALPNANSKELFVARFLVFFIFVLVFVIILFIASYATLKDYYKNTMLPGLSIGNVIVEGKTKEQISEYFTNTLKVINDKKLTITKEEKPFATYSAQLFNPTLDYSSSITKAYNVGREENVFIRGYTLLRQTIAKTPVNIPVVHAFNNDAVKFHIASIEAKINIPPQDAVFEEENGKVKRIRLQKEGYGVDNATLHREISQKIQELLVSTKEAEMVALQVATLQPKLSLKDVNPYGVEELIGEGKSDYTGSIPNRIFNLTLAAGRLSGSVFEPNKEHSFNRQIGNVGSETGYKSAYVIIGGRTQLGDGGGVCQVSTTFFRTLLNTGLPITERNQHAYRVGYYENDSKAGVDAAIYTPNTDLKFINDTPSHIVVMLEHNLVDRIITFKLYGKKDGRIASATTPIISNITPALATIYEDDPTLKRGVKKQIDFAAAGATAQFDYKVLKDGKEHFSKKFVSNYKPWAAVYKVGTAD
jgi:vancomycin resistance protein YoaR